MAGPRYTLAQTRARVHALELCVTYLEEQIPDHEDAAHQFRDIQTKLINEITRLRERAQQSRKQESRNNRPI